MIIWIIWKIKVSNSQVIELTNKNRGLSVTTRNLKTVLQDSKGQGPRPNTNQTACHHQETVHITCWLKCTQNLVFWSFIATIILQSSHNSASNYVIKSTKLAETSLCRNNCKSNLYNAWVLYYTSSGAINNGITESHLILLHHSCGSTESTLTPVYRQGFCHGTTCTGSPDTPKLHSKLAKERTQLITGKTAIDDDTIAHLHRFMSPSMIPALENLLSNGTDAKL